MIATRYATRSIPFTYGRYNDLIGMIALAALLPLLVLLPVPLMRVPFGLAMALFVPGYALTAALFARRNDLDRPQRLALSFGLSAALLPVLALLLDRLPWGLRLWPMVVALALWIVLWSTVALVRRALLPADQIVVLPRLTRRSVPRLGLGGAAALVLIVGGALVLREPPPATEFYALGRTGLANDFPRQIVAGQPATVQLGITNNEPTAQRFQIEIVANNTPIRSVDAIELAAGARWQQPISFTLPRAGDDQIVDLILQRADDPTPYRQLRLWINVKESRP